MKTILLTALAALLGAAACAGSEAPNATVVSATPEQLVPADDALDDLVITVDYGDGDGDLGGGTAEVYDCRADGLVTELPIPEIAPDAIVGKPIRGRLVLHVNDVGAAAAAAPPAICRDLGVDAVGAGTAVFCVVLVDTAGHAGDGDCTGEIAVAADGPAARRR